MLTTENTGDSDLKVHALKLLVRVRLSFQKLLQTWQTSRKDNERNLCQDLLTIENNDPDLKVREPHYANELIVRVRLSFQKLLQTHQTSRNNQQSYDDAFFNQLGITISILLIELSKLLVYFHFRSVTSLCLC